MARTLSPLGSATAALLTLLALTGCQQQSMVGSLPAPNFNGPSLPEPPRVAPLPPPSLPKVAVAPQPVNPLPLPRAWAGVPAAWIPAGAVRPWHWIVVHHSATPTGGAMAFDAMHRAKGWDELGYDFVIGNGTDTADGQIEVGPRWTKQKQGAHAKTPDNRFNEYGIGICLVGNFDVSRPTAAQLRSLSKLTAYLMKTYRVRPGDVVGHGDTKATDCPGRHLNLAEVRRSASQMFAADTGAGLEIQASAGTELLVATPGK